MSNIDLLEERFAFMANERDDGDWQEVCERAARLLHARSRLPRSRERSRRSSRSYPRRLIRTAAATIAVAAVVVAVPALAVAERAADLFHSMAELIAFSEQDLSDEKPLLRLETAANQAIRLYVVDEGRCHRLEFPGGAHSGTCGPRPKEHEIIVAVGRTTPGGAVLHGEVGRGIERLEVRFGDGRTDRLPLKDGFTLYGVSREWPVAVVGRNRRGEVVVEQALPPGRADER